MRPVLSWASAGDGLPPLSAPRWGSVDWHSRPPTPPGLWVPCPCAHAFPGPPQVHPSGVPRRSPCTLGYLSIPSPSNFGYSPTPHGPSPLPRHSGALGNPPLCCLPLPPHPRAPPCPAPTPPSSEGRGLRAPGWECLVRSPGRAGSRAPGNNEGAWVKGKLDDWRGAGAGKRRRLSLLGFFPFLGFLDTSCGGGQAPSERRDSRRRI